MGGWCIRIPAAYQPVRPAAQHCQANWSPSWYRKNSAGHPPTASNASRRTRTTPSVIVVMVPGALRTARAQPGDPAARRGHIVRAGQSRLYVRGPRVLLRFGNEPGEDVGAGEGGVVVEEEQPLGRVGYPAEGVGAGVAPAGHAEVLRRADGERAGRHDFGLAAIADHAHPHVDTGLREEGLLGGGFLGWPVVHRRHDDVATWVGHVFLHPGGSRAVGAALHEARDGAALDGTVRIAQRVRGHRGRAADRAELNSNRGSGGLRRMG